MELPFDQRFFELKLTLTEIFTWAHVNPDTAIPSVRERVFDAVKDAMVNLENDRIAVVAFALQSAEGALTETMTSESHRERAKKLINAFEARKYEHQNTVRRR